MLDRATTALRQALGRVRGHAPPQDLLAQGRRNMAHATLEQLGLSEQPFSDRTPSAQLFIDHAIRMQINVLAQQLCAGEVLPVLRGETGSGKTSLLIRLMADHADAMHFFVTRGGTGLNARRIVFDMLRMLTRPVPCDPAECYRELARRLRGLVVDGLPAVLVIDDADLMVDGELQNLLAVHDSLRSALNGRFNTLMAGGPNLETRLSALNSVQVRSGQLVTGDLRPLNQQRMAEFLDHRLRTAGLSDDLPLTDNDLQRIAAATGGLPRDVEIAAVAVLEARLGATDLTCT